MKNLFVFTLLLAGLMMVSCGDDSGPVFNVTAPTDGASFAAGDVITFAGTVTDDVSVETLTIAISDGILSTMNVDLVGGTDRTSVSLGGLEVTLNEMTGAGDFVITLVATDDEGNSTTEEIDFSVQ